MEFRADEPRREPCDKADEERVLRRYDIRLRDAKCREYRAGRSDFLPVSESPHRRIGRKVPERFRPVRDEHLESFECRGLHSLTARHRTPFVEHVPISRERQYIHETNFSRFWAKGLPRMCVEFRSVWISI